MYLRSLVNQSVIISKSNLSLHLQKDELIHTEYSRKFQVSQIRELLTSAGFKIKHIWLDPGENFSLSLVSKH
jgi:uncharacterized SAM-dependent methyltransferase